MTDVPDATVVRDASRWSRPSSPVPIIPRPHKKYYIDDPMVVFLVRTLAIDYADHRCIHPESFQVEGRLIRVHRYLLERESGFLRDMFALPPEANPEGLTDDRPILLGQSMGVTLKDVEALLNYIYWE